MLFALSLYILFNKFFIKLLAGLHNTRFLHWQMLWIVYFSIYLFHSPLRVGKATCALFFSWDLTSCSEVHPPEGGCEKAAGAGQ